MRHDELQRTIDDLVETYRERCLWFLRPDYFPETDEARLRVLDQIQRYGDREAFVRAGEAKQWRSRSCSDRSGDC